jgi:hypothetical protein
MKYMNHLRKLALLSSLALSYSVYADGTLPLPLEMTDPNLALKLNVETVDSTPRTRPLLVNGLRVQACTTSTDELYTATGSVSYDGTEYTVLGVCKPKTNPLKRTIVTTDPDATRITTLDGTADRTFSTFAGKLSHKLLVSPVTGPGVSESETLNPLPTVDFKLRR